MLAIAAVECVDELCSVRGGDASCAGAGAGAGTGAVAGKEEGVYYGAAGAGAAAGQKPVRLRAVGCCGTRRLGGREICEWRSDKAGRAIDYVWLERRG